MSRENFPSAFILNIIILFEHTQGQPTARQRREMGRSSLLQPHFVIQAEMAAGFGPIKRFHLLLVSLSLCLQDIWKTYNLISMKCGGPNGLVPRKKGIWFWLKSRSGISAFTWWSFYSCDCETEGVRELIPDPKNGCFQGQETNFDLKKKIKKKKKELNKIKKQAGELLMLEEVCARWMPSERVVQIFYLRRSMALQNFISELVTLRRGDKTRQQDKERKERISREWKPVLCEAHMCVDYV